MALLIQETFFINMTISDFFFIPVLYANCRVGIQQSWGNVLSEAMRALTYIVM